MGFPEHAARFQAVTNFLEEEVVRPSFVTHQRSVDQLKCPRTFGSFGGNCSESTLLHARQGRLSPGIGSLELV